VAGQAGGRELLMSVLIGLVLGAAAGPVSGCSCAGFVEVLCCRSDRWKQRAR